MAEVLGILESDPQQGLTIAEVSRRQKAWGKNVLPRGRKTTIFELVGRQFTSPLVYILLLAAVLTWWIGEYIDMTVILIVVAVNAIIGFFQEHRARKIFEKLKALVRVEAFVTREGRLESVDSLDLVPGDIIILKAGNKIPADARLISASNLIANEAILTGESEPISKSPGTLKPKTSLSDRTNLVYMGTLLEQGEGRAIVIATGLKTEIGKITLLTETIKDELTPLQIRTKKLGIFLSELFLVISASIFLVGLTRQHSVVEMLKTTIAVAVAAIPEGLPAAISVILAVSSQKILNRRGLVMRLLAAETLGSTSVICTDKTGTLTYGKMKVEEIFSDNKDLALVAMALANEAVLEEHNGKLLVKGEPTDKAKLERFLEEKKDYDELLHDFPKIAILSFDPVRKYIASFHQVRAHTEIFLSGAPEQILEICKLSPAKKEEIKKLYEDHARRGFRVIALAHKTLQTSLKEPYEAKNLILYLKDLDYLGLITIRDPIREDVNATLKLTRRAGIKILMITGDHLLTANATGRELGFGYEPGQIILGEELDKMTDQDLGSRIRSLEIIARATPEHKIRIIAAWQKLGAVVAMTGDGVNDAPALRAANIGVAVGSGTDVSKEASDLILLNDSFSTITAAVEEGRTSFANIRKATLVVMANAFTELLLIASSLVFNVPFPITAVQILWVNLVTDSLPVLALAFEPGDKEIMRQSPIPPKEPILDRQAKFLIFGVNLFTDFLLFGIFLYLFNVLNWDLVKIRTFIFTAIALPPLFTIFAYKSLSESLFKIPLFNNRLLILAVGTGLTLMALAIYAPALNKFLSTSPLEIGVLSLVFLFAFLKLGLVELYKLKIRNKK